MDGTLMDTEMDVQAREESRRAEIRQRSEEALADVERMRATPVDPEIRRRAAEWMAEHEARKAQERAAEAKRAARESVAPPVQKAAPAPAQKPVSYLRKSTFDAWKEALLEAMAKALRDKGNEAVARATWRTMEAERRIEDLEARIARLEGRGNG